MSRQLLIDKINIRLPRGWQGDANQLALMVAEQIQRQAAELQSARQLDLRLQGHFAGDARQVAEQLGSQLADPNSKASRSRRRDR